MIPRSPFWRLRCVYGFRMLARSVRKQLAAWRARVVRHLTKATRRWVRHLATVVTTSAVIVGAEFCFQSAAMAQAPVMATLPTGANVVAGSAAITAGANVVDINATTSRTIIQWQDFSVGAGNTANFHLPDANSAVLNRVTTANTPSMINGAINSNGHVYLVNPSGVVVGAGGVISTNAFVASTFDIANNDFLSGGALKFIDNGSQAAIVNNGTINTGSGGAHLIANNIANNGTITSVGGNITLSGGGSVTLSNGATYVQPTLETLASGISPTAGLIKNTGTIRATGAVESGGEVYLANPNGKIRFNNK